MSDDILKASFTKYINLVIRNTAINYFKKKRYRQSKETNLNEIINVPLSENDDGTIFLSKNEISYSDLEKIFSNHDYFNAMKSLTNKQKLVLYLTAVENYSSVEIAKILNISETTVRTTLYKAKEKFKKNLKKGK